jgi:hypothetical protein
MKQRGNKYSEIFGVLFSSAQGAILVHVYHTFHHVLTIQKTTFATLFFSKHPLKHWLNSKTPDRSGVLFF